MVNGWRPHRELHCGDRPIIRDSHGFPLIRFRGVVAAYPSPPFRLVPVESPHSAGPDRRRTVENIIKSLESLQAAVKTEIEAQVTPMRERADKLGRG